MGTLTVVIPCQIPIKSLFRNTENAFVIQRFRVCPRPRP